MCVGRRRTAPDVVVTNNEAARRYEVHVGGELAGLTTYHADRRPGGVHPRRGLSALGGTRRRQRTARAALDDVIAHGKLITPKCPFIVNYVEHHPAYLDHVDARHRGELEADISDIERSRERSSDACREPMTDDEALAFLADGTRTGKVGTTRADGRPHVAPIWFIIDDDDIVFMTGAETLKGRALRRDPRAALVVDLEEPPYAFVLVEGTVSLSTTSRRCCRCLSPSPGDTSDLTTPKTTDNATRSRANCSSGCILTRSSRSTT